METISIDLKNLAKPLKKNCLDELIEKSKEIAHELGLDLDGEAPL